MNRCIYAVAAVLLLMAADAAQRHPRAPDDTAWHFCTCRAPFHGQHIPFRLDNTPDTRTEDV